VFRNFRAAVDALIADASFHVTLVVLGEAGPTPQMALEGFDGRRAI
jgi:hypothetical protein